MLEKGFFLLGQRFSIQVIDLGQQAAFFGTQSFCHLCHHYFRCVRASLPPAPPLHIQWAAASEQLEEEVGQACYLQEERQHCFSDKGPATKLLRRPLTMPNEDGGE